MIELGVIPNARMAQAFIDYLAGLGISCHAMPVEQGVKLVLANSTDLIRASEELELFIKNPNDPKYLQASWDNGDAGVKFDYGSGGLGLAAQFITGAGPLTLVIFAVCVLLFAVMNLGFGNQVYSALSFFNAVPGADLEQIWRVFTPSLMHGSIMHVVFNLLWWWYLGGKIENRLGTMPLLTLLLVAGTLPNIVQYFVSGPNFLGISGVVYALVGYSYLMGKRSPQSGIFLPDSYMGFMIIWLVLGFTDILGVSMANGAHIGGLAVGLLQARIDSRNSRHIKH
ncbi:rhomboid family intramembrane serine protease GlpG [Shewanella maritima]|uniref:Rhomboid family intramembrane serine protease GlpG n=1 Tax=Shewanella maritima TaxID=2520507 RepID=A0A411PHX4_9GAMM|nr:rhomboid family intramembrane serine protease GlpG [Shewanella maritima]QBF83145.1 rhomboid family intramembrane serine protease GlpG [Shewanella maritima]